MMTRSSRQGWQRLSLAALVALTTACGAEIADRAADQETRADDVNTTAVVPGRIEAENFSNGGEGVGFHDSTAANLGNLYRKRLGVDVESCQDVDGGFDVAWVEAGEWLAFELSVAQPGSYAFTARVASGAEGTKSLHLELDGQVLPVASFTDASGWQSWRDLDLGRFTLSAGAHSARIVFDTDELNLNYVQGTVATAPSCTPRTCASAGKNCGTISDGCGATLSCGSCAAPMSCGGGGVSNLCGCMPTTCEAEGATCGSIADGCGGTLTCGSCATPMTCGGGGVANTCGGGSTSTSGTLLGSSVNGPLFTTLGRAKVPVTRVYLTDLPAGATWSGSGAIKEGVAKASKAIWISFKEANPALVDAFLATKPATLGLQVYATYHHEPEDNFTTAASQTTYRETWAKMGPVIRKHGAIPALILMRYTLTPSSGRDWRNYYAPGSVDMLGWDSYRKTDAGVLDVSDQIDPILAVSQATGLPWGIGETGSTSLRYSAADTAKWAAALRAYGVAHGAKVMCWWDQDTFKFDTATMHAWLD